MKLQVGDIFVSNRSKITGTITKITKLDNPRKDRITIEWCKNDPKRLSNDFTYSLFDIESNLVWGNWTHYPVKE